MSAQGRSARPSCSINAYRWAIRSIAAWKIPAVGYFHRSIAKLTAHRIFPSLDSEAYRHTVVRSEPVQHRNCQWRTTPHTQALRMRHPGDAHGARLGGKAATQALQSMVSSHLVDRRWLVRTTSRRRLRCSSGMAAVPHYAVISIRTADALRSGTSLALARRSFGFVDVSAVSSKACRDWGWPSPP